MLGDTKLRQYLGVILEGKSLTKAQMHEVMQQIMTGQVSDIVIASFLVALRMKGESGDEIEGAVEVMRDLALPVDLGEHKDEAIDIVGTGGDGAQLFNVSTASAMVVSAAGGYVAKHGSRALSSKSGSADFLECAGARLDIKPENIPAVLNETHFGFMFAPHHHKAMKHAANVRTIMAQRTIFNLLGPMTNPARIKRQVMGCYDQKWLEPLAKALVSLGSERVILVHSHDGLDEVSLAAPSRVVEINNGILRSYDVSPEGAGINSRPWDSCIVESAEQSYELVCKAFSGEHEDAADFIALNAGLAIYLADICDSFASGVELAASEIAKGTPMETLNHYVSATQKYAEA